MAEASCSGTTPFKRLIDHPSSTGASPQDRLVDRTGASTSFRSTPIQQDPSSHNSFGAFVNGAPALPSFPHDPATRLASHASNLHHPPAFSFPFANAPAAESSRSLGASWAADFSRFSAAQAQIPRPPMATTTSARPGYYAPPLQQQQQHQGRAFAPAFSAGGFAGQGDFDAEMARWMRAHGGGNMAEVDAAMDRMARELEETALRDGERDGELADLSLEVNDWKEELREETEEEKDTKVEAEEEKDQEGEKEEERVVSGVAEAAERLLDCVKHEDGEKWQKSVFLSLMRDFRDGKKDIVGDEIRTHGESTSPQGLQTELHT